MIRNGSKNEKFHQGMNENGNKKKQVNDDVNSAVSFPSIFTEIIKNLLSFFNRVTVSEYYWD